MNDNRAIQRGSAAWRLPAQRPQDEAVTYGELRSCVWKVSYASRGYAKEAAKRLHAGATKPYRCPYCGLFHLATKPNRKAA